MSKPVIVRTAWKENEVFSSSQDGQVVQMDGNREKGFSPKSLLLSGLSACAGIDVVEILQKMRVNINGLEIEARTTQTEDHPKVYTDIELIFKVGADAGSEDKVRKAIELSLEKYCGVAAMLRKHTNISYKLELN